MRLRALSLTVSRASRNEVVKAVPVRMIAALLAALLPAAPLAAADVVPYEISVILPLTGE